MLKIAIIDPNELVRGSLKTVLNAHGHNACSFETSSLFHSLHKESDFDFLLIDMDSLELTRFQILAWAKTQSSSNPKIALMSGWHSETDLSSLLASTRINFLSKPFSQSKLLEIVKSDQSDDPTC
jgi:DNA-binding response OmpR family regulator